MLVMIMSIVNDSQQLRRIDLAVSAAGDAPYFGVKANMRKSRFADMLRARRAKRTGAWAVIAQDGLAVQCADLLAVFQPWTNFRHYSSAAGQSP